MENHSLTNLFGFACANGTLGHCPSVAMPASVTLADGVKVRPSVDPDTVPNVLHNPKFQILGMRDQWDKIGGCSRNSTPPYACISGYRPSQEPNLISLAKHFAWSDMTFSMLTSSWGSHLFTAASTLDGFDGTNPVPVTRGNGWGCDSTRVTTYGPSKQWVPACVPDYHLSLPHGGAFESTPVPYTKTIFDKLGAAGLGWHVYGAGVSGGGLDPSAGGYIWSICPTFAECLYTSQANSVVPTAQFFTDAAGGKLPSYSVIAPGEGYAKDSEHNKQSMTAGDNFLGQVASAVMKGPQWSSTVLLITYDDCGCFYDAATPGRNPDGTPQSFRVPVLLVSPFAKPGYVDSTPASQASIAALVEQIFGLPALSANDQKAYRYGQALCLPPACTQAPTAPVKMIKRPLPASARHLGNAGAYADS
jgi:hypothetical protein